MSDHEHGDTAECARCLRPVTRPRRVRGADGEVRTLGSYCARVERDDAQANATSALRSVGA